MTTLWVFEGLQTITLDDLEGEEQRKRPLQDWRISKGVDLRREKKGGREEEEEGEEDNETKSY